jgi:hypothetical protein
MMTKPIGKLLAVAFTLSATTALATPRTLANGAPAPGNTVAKSKPAMIDRRDERALETARVRLADAIREQVAAVHALAIQPRTLPDGSPACGNTVGKSMCTAQTAEDYYQQRLARAHQAQIALEQARARLHEITRKVAMEQRATEDDYS